MDPKIVKLVWLTNGQQPIGRKVIRSALTGVSMLVLAGYLGACSSVPDAVNPVSWYHGVESWFEDDEAPPPEVKTAAAEETAKTPGEGKSFPSVNEVPDKPATQSTVEERREMMQELGADKANAQYVEETESAAAASAGDTEAGMAVETEEVEVAAAQAPAGGDISPEDAPPPPPPPAAAEEPILDLSSPLPPSDRPPPLTADTPPPAPPAPPAPAEAVSPASPGSGELDEVYEEKLQESAPTVTTDVAGPTAPPPGAGAAGPVEGAMGSAPPPFEAPSSPVAQAEMQMAATTMPPAFLGPSTQLATIYFGNNSAALRDSERKKIREVAAAYKERGGRLRVYGYASSRTADMDPVTHQMVNFDISVRRADAVTRALIAQGVKAEDVHATALSDTQPIYYESMPAGEAGNRRVEIFVDYY